MTPVDVDFYAAAGPLTELTSDQTEMVVRLPRNPTGLCLAAQRLLVSPPDAAGAGLSEQRMTERNTRPARALMRRALELDGATPLDRARSVEHRVVGTCRHYAVLATAFLRADGRARPSTVRLRDLLHPTEEGRPLDRRVLVGRRSDAGSASIPSMSTAPPPATLGSTIWRPGEFLIAGEAWLLIRSGAQDPADFGVFGTENWGPG